jgi:methionyl-tRNA formyltransferase
MARIVFMGTPDFAVASLQALAQAHTILGVVTQPDRPAGRGRQTVPPPVKDFALQAGLPVIQPQRLREPEAMAQLQAWAPELIVMAAFGQILRPAVLDLPPRGCLNVHASLLPRHRGAAPVAAAILAGDAQTGVTIMRIDPGLDTGPILAQRSLTISPDDTTATLTERLASLGADLLLDVIPDYLAGRLQPTLQDDSRATYAPQLKKVDGKLDFTRPAVELERKVRAFNPWPGAYALWPDPAGGPPRPLKVMYAKVLSERVGTSGEVVATPDGPAVGCDAGALILDVVQPPGKRAMPSSQFVNGARSFIGSRLG